MTKGWSAADVWRLAARRGSRALRNVLAKPPLWSPLPRSIREAALLECFGCGREDLARRLAAARPHLCANRVEVGKALDRFPEARGRALDRAEAVADGRFWIFGREVAFPPGAIDWSLDPSSGVRYPTERLEMAQLLVPGADPKLPWALGRGDHWVALGQGVWAARSAPRRARFAQAFVAQVERFWRDAPPGMGIQWTSPMEVALRGANLAQAIAMMADEPAVGTPGFLLLALDALVCHAEHVERHLEDGAAVPNNHLVSNLVGLLAMAALFPELPGSARWGAHAARDLPRQMTLQVHPDGMSFEGSLPYHRLSTELFTLGHLAAMARRTSLGAAYLQRLRRMFAVAAAYCSEEGLAPQVGDNDSGRALFGPDRESLSHGYLASFGVALFGDPSLKVPGASFPDEALWHLGEAGWARWAAARPTSPVRAFTSPEAGLHLLRVPIAGARAAGSRWAVLTVNAGPKGQRGIGGHSHHDQLSFELHVGGRPLIVDPGTGQYTRDPSERNRLRGCGAHNALLVDGRGLPVPDGRPFALPDAAPAECRVFAPGDVLARMEVRSLAFAPVEIRRQFLLDARAGALVIADALAASDAAEHTWTRLLQLPDERAEVRGATASELARAKDAAGVSRALSDEVVALGPPDRPWAVVFVEAGARCALEPSIYSPGYAEVRPARLVRCTREGRLPARGVWVVLWTMEETKP